MTIGKIDTIAVFAAGAYLSCIISYKGIFLHSGREIENYKYYFDFNDSQFKSYIVNVAIN